MYQLYCADTNDDGGLDNELKSELNVPRMTYQFMKEVQIFHLHIVLDVNFQMNEVTTLCLVPFFLSLASITGDIDLNCII